MNCNKKRIIQAVKYLNSHKTKKVLLESANKIKNDLLSDSLIVSGHTFNFVNTICKRFKIGFTKYQYITILLSLNKKYSDKQKKHFSWV